MTVPQGSISVGADADIVVWNGFQRRVISAKTHHHAVDFNIFEGMEVFGVADVTISRGRVVWRDGTLCMTSLSLSHTLTRISLSFLCFLHH